MRFETTEQETLAFVNMIRTGIATDANGSHERRTLDAINRGADIVENVVTKIANLDESQLKNLCMVFGPIIAKILGNAEPKQKQEAPEPAKSEEKTEKKDAK